MGLKQTSNRQEFVLRTGRKVMVTSGPMTQIGRFITRRIKALQPTS
jgi:hypothetical protein